MTRLRRALIHASLFGAIAIGLYGLLGLVAIVSLASGRCS
jgi:hypothetical protein